MNKSDQGPFQTPLTNPRKSQISKIHAYALRKKLDQKKVPSNKQKTTKNHSQHQIEGFQTHFQSTNVGRDHPGGL